MPLNKIINSAAAVNLSNDDFTRIVNAVVARLRTSNTFTTSSSTSGTPATSTTSTSNNNGTTGNTLPTNLYNQLVSFLSHVVVRNGQIYNDTDLISNGNLIVKAPDNITIGTTSNTGTLMLTNDVITIGSSNEKDVGQYYPAYNTFVGLVNGSYGVYANASITTNTDGTVSVSGTKVVNQEVSYEELTSASASIDITKNISAIILPENTVAQYSLSTTGASSDMQKEIVNLGSGIVKLSGPVQAARAIVNTIYLPFYGSNIVLGYRQMTFYIKSISGYVD